MNSNVRHPRIFKFQLEVTLVTALELDGNDLGPLINYTKEILYDEAEKHFRVN